MALTKAARSKISNLVQQAKRSLFNEVESQLAQHYGIRPDGKVLEVEELASNDAGILYTAALLRQRLDYLRSNIPDAKKRSREGFQQLVREQAFTILNRFASLRLAEERGIIRESIRQGYNSEGFLVFDQLTGGSKTAPQFDRYKWYLFTIFDELAQDLPSVFSRFSPYALIFPGEDALLQLLALINDEELTVHREKGKQPVNLWREDETIGWMYQYYNSREEIKAMRDASSAPRNSRELAVRNQFFTPRYVVQFLTDNSLGRIWYEMTKGETALTDFCEYLVRQPGEVFLEQGEKRAEAPDGETTYIEHRPMKDPRDITMIDPACGSMHFGLYAFDLYEKIYLEAWDRYPELLGDLREKMTRTEFERLIPSLIIRYNIHGVDIDPRAVQIAGLSLWLRAQRTYQRLELEPKDRPPITKANLVCAEAMPGDKALLEEFLQKVDAPLRPLIRTIWDKMQLAGETGVLLKIEEELKNAIAETKEEWAKYQNVQGVQGDLFERNTPAIQLEFDQLKLYKRLKQDFFQQAEDLVLSTLKYYSETATNRGAFSRQLFAEDTARGFSFIDLCRKRYDVGLMNPPFGASSKDSRTYIDKNYPSSRSELAAVFIDRMLSMLKPNTYLGAITTRTIFFMGSVRNWRKEKYINTNRLPFYVDLGGGVLDATVETALSVTKRGTIKDSIFFRITKEENKEFTLKSTIENIKSAENIFRLDTRNLQGISKEPLCYWVDDKSVCLFNEAERFENEERGAKQGPATADNPRFTRNIWEIKYNDVSLDRKSSHNKKWSFYLISTESQRFYLEIYSVVNWLSNGYELKNFVDEKGNRKSVIRNEFCYYHNGLSWSYRTEKFQPHLIPNGTIPSHGRVLAVFPEEEEILVATGLWNSTYWDYLLKLSMEKEGAVAICPRLDFKR